ncbi:hypothetical protein GCM10009551_037980 [Nocardiopsis tropica]|uniref:hypothetical protein n=1 Tax=Nocardiopsis tropica TaxID=109330 RepID=UPI003371AE7F
MAPTTRDGGLRVLEPPADSRARPGVRLGAPSGSGPGQPRAPVVESSIVLATG